MKRQRIKTDARIERAERAQRRNMSSETCLSPVRQNAQTNADDAKDIISSLPDSLLTHILSFLPIQDSVSTSILSSRWRPLWTLVPVLHLKQLELEERMFRLGNENFKFEDIVSRIWTLRNAISNPIPPLHKLCIHWYCHCLPFYVETWLRATNMRDLRELDLCLDHQPLELPRSLYFSTTLVVLKLGNNIRLNPPSACAFPCLRILLLKWVTFANRDSLSTILNACPVLLDLTLHVVGIDFDVVVLVDTLKSLHLRWNIHTSSKYIFQINTPALEYFHFSGYLNGDDVLENLPNVVESVVQIKNRDRINDYAKRAWDFVGKLYNVISMELSTVTAQILCHDSNHENSPTFRNLSSLRFCGDLWHEWYAWHAVRLLLCRAPELQTLVFELSFLVGPNLDNPNPCLEEPLDVPECMSSHLKTCLYKGFKGVENEMELARQILKAARVLKTMKITSHGGLDPRKKPSVRKKLRKFQRSSRNCQIAFDEGHFT